MNFAIVNLGCKVNRVESDSFASGLLARGGVETGPDSADVVVVNTCTVTGEAEKKTRKAVRQVLRANLGCGGHWLRRGHRCRCVHVHGPRTRAYRRKGAGR